MPKTGTEIIACGQAQDIGSPVVLWNKESGFTCPHPRGRKKLSQHDPALNDGPTQSLERYQFRNAKKAYEELTENVSQLILHFDMCFSSYHCHQVLTNSEFKGSHFYLDLDGTIYQTTDLYWKTNTAPSDDRQGNERSVHVEIANLSWQALQEEADLYPANEDRYKMVDGKWLFLLPDEYRKHLLVPDYQITPARYDAKNGFFEETINGRQVRMWDFTEDQYQSLIDLCLGITKLLPGVEAKVPQDPCTGETPFSKIAGFAQFSGILGHAHVQAGETQGIACKYDPGSSFDWQRLRLALGDAEKKV